LSTIGSVCCLRCLPSPCRPLSFRFGMIFMVAGRMGPACSKTACHSLSCSWSRLCNSLLSTGNLPANLARQLHLSSRLPPLLAARLAV
jgi:hypothetical protein